MSTSRHAFGRSRWVAIVLGVTPLAAGVAHGASAGNDDAGNYTVATFTNNANGGTGFGAWQFNLQAGAKATLDDSSVFTGNINSTNGLAFMFLGGAASTYGEATRDFNAALSVGDEFKATFAYNWNGGARGMNVLNSSGGELFNINYGGADTLSFSFNGGISTNLRTDYVSTATVSVVVQQLAGNQLTVTITRNDGYTTNFTSTSLASPAAKVKVYNGGHDAGSTNYALFVNNLEIVPSSALTLTVGGQDAMAAGMTNLLTLTRGGSVASGVTVTLASSSATNASVPASVSFNAGDSATNFPVTGLTLGTTRITATGAGYTTGSLDVAVFDLGYDDSSYYPPGIFSNGGDGGLGFQPWILLNNNGSGDGFTNFAGSFIGGSTANGGGNVDSSSGNAFGLYANGTGTGTNTPYFEAIRLFDSALAIGQAASVEFGVNFRNGSKGIVFQNSGSWLFEVGVFSDDYWYNNHTDANPPTSLGWSYAADTAIKVTLKRISGNQYDITIVRRGSSPQTNVLSAVNLGATPPNEIRAYVYGTDGGGENNLFVNRFALWTAPGSGFVDGIPTSWWDRYSIAEAGRVATNNPDGDVPNNLEEYIADTDPTSSASFFPNVITSAPGAAVTSILAGPTTNSRVYDVWWTTDLKAAPQTWTRYNLNVTGNGSNVTLQVTNDAPTRAYRSGVALP